MGCFPHQPIFQPEGEACRNARRKEEGTSKVRRLRKGIMSGKVTAAAANLRDSRRK